ncbi:MAG TPA: tripartite tricarboxylate transporter permease [Thermodesulfobacteriota bacterium]|nr:tripartite tricarboxylate transporter permease [Thermodesulfobacteriota bacterium]
MDILHNMQLGFSVAMTAENLFYCFVGCLVGTMIGVLPGIGPLATLSMLLPVTYKLNPTASIIMLSGIFYGSMYGGSTTSVLVNIPGEAASVVTCLDGYQMARKGRAGAALGIAAIGSFIAGTISAVGLNLLSPVLVIAALQFGPPEYFAVMTLGFVATLFMVGGSAMKGLVMLALGLFVSCVGLDFVYGAQRFTFGVTNLMNGADLVAVVMGMFGVSEILLNMEEQGQREIFTTKVKGIWPNRKDLRDSALPILRGSVLGFVLGLLPGAGNVTASFISYGMERKLSRYPEKFGTGVIEGVAGPESANNSAVAGSMIPLLSLGLPCNPITALLMGALIIHGVQPGPMLISRNPEIYWGVIASFYIGNVMLLILNLPLIGIWVQFLKIPYRVLFPLILLLCTVGTYSTNLNVFDVWMMVGFGLLGYLLRKRDYELAPFILALVLGPLFEQSLRQSLILSAKDPGIFFNRPISLGLLLVSVLLVVFFAFDKLKTRPA